MKEFVVSSSAHLQIQEKEAATAFIVFRPGHINRREKETEEPCRLKSLTTASPTKGKERV